VANRYNDLEHIPVIRLTDEMFSKDPVLLLQELEAKYRFYGAVKLVKPDHWKPSLANPAEDEFLTIRQQTLSKLSLAKPFKQLKDSFLFSEYKKSAL
jgi:hypothetical protein